MAEHDALMRTVIASTTLGNTISLKMVQFLNEVKDQPVGFRDLGHDFLAICQILNALSESLDEHFQTKQPFPEKAIPELNKIMTKTGRDFTELQALLQKFIDFENGGAYAMVQKQWRRFFADKDITKIQSSLNENKGAFKMTMLLTNM
jgi:hypothetical protein